MPTVSVIIPSYNAAEYIAQTLESVLAQTLSDIEVIVVDDGSTDSTRDVVAEFACKDSRVTLVEQANQFAGVARNNGMAKARGTYLYFLDADDYIEKPFSPSVLVARVKAHLAQVDRLQPSPAEPAVLTVGPLTAKLDARQIFKNGVELPLKNREYELLLFLMRHPGQVFSREDLYEMI